MARLSVETILLPALLEPAYVQGKSAVVFDVLRATTSITAALAIGVKELRLFGDIESAASAAREFAGQPLLCGEMNCLPPPGFDLGNSPGAFGAHHAVRTAFMATTNGTKALIAARGAHALFAGALVNAGAVAQELLRQNRAVTLLCAGTKGQIAMEDMLGAGAVLDHLLKTGQVDPVGDASAISLELFRANRNSLPQALAATTGGQNVIASGLQEDIEFCARLDALPIVGVVQNDPLRVVRLGR